MILSFPRPYPDELLYSLFARYHIFSGSTSNKATLKDLYGISSAYPVMDLPGHLDITAQRLGPPWTSEELLLKHTLYPYYTYFFTTERATKVKELMFKGKGNNIHTSIGINGSTVKPKNNLWICEKCIQQDMNVHGESYWRRMHQLPCVYFCAKHGVKLSETHVVLKQKDEMSFVAANPYLEKEEVNLQGMNNKELEMLLNISIESESLLSLSDEEHIGDTIREQYVHELRERGYVNSNGKIFQETLHTAFHSFYSKSFLEKTQSTLNQKSDWLKLIFRKHQHAFPPINHLLISLFFKRESKLILGKETADFVILAPFGPGPWPCLNKVCPKFHQESITEVILGVSHNTKKRTGKFCCHTCGFMFFRNGPDTLNADCYKIGTVKEYGHIWKRRLSGLIQANVSQKDIAAELGVDSATVKRQARAMGISTTWKCPMSIEEKVRQKKESKEEKLNRNKEKWLSLQKEYPNLSKGELRRQYTKVAYYLWTYDKEWANANSPAKLANYEHRVQFNWDERDKELVEKIRNLISEWDIGAKKLTRITFSRIGRKLGLSAMLEKSITKLPKTKQYIDEVVEDVKTFEKRRVRCVIANAKKNGEALFLWNVITKANLTHSATQELKEYINRQLDDYNI